VRDDAWCPEGNRINLLELPWVKHAKQRPRSGRGHTYTPTATKKAEAFLREQFLFAMPDDFTPIEQSIGVSIVLRRDNIDFQVFPYTPHEVRSLSGDIDNYAKTILDALNGVAWKDDKQIERLFVVKT
jgi:Holliday junction resolvase RusA-like endonuclease